MSLVLEVYKTHVLFSKGEAAPSHISSVMDTLQFCKLLSFSLVCNFEINLDFLFTRA